MSEPREVLDVWFEGVEGNSMSPAAGKRWFAKDEAFDAMLRGRFLPDLARASTGELGSWCATPEGALAFIVLCDQLSRNCHRGSPEAFARDALAVHTAFAGVSRGDHLTLALPQRMFFLMPFMHSESLAMHDLATREFQGILDDAEKTAPALVAWAKSTLDYEAKHRVIIERFGRYPHRNAVLGRPSTEAEIAFLKEPGSSF